MNPGRYRKKGSALEIEAMQVGEDVSEIANWTQSQIIEERDAITGGVMEAVNVKTGNGRTRASRGSWVCKYGDAFFVVGHNTFSRKYEGVGKSEITPPEPPPERPKMVTTDPFEGMTRFNDGSRP